MADRAGRAGPCAHLRLAVGVGRLNGLLTLPFGGGRRRERGSRLSVSFIIRGPVAPSRAFARGPGCCSWHARRSAAATMSPRDPPSADGQAQFVRRDDANMAGRDGRDRVGRRRAGRSFGRISTRASRRPRPRAGSRSLIPPRRATWCAAISPPRRSRAERRSTWSGTSSPRTSSAPSGSATRSRSGAQATTPGR